MRARAFSLIAMAYAAGLVAAAITVVLVPSTNPIVQALWADVVATCTIFGFSLKYNFFSQNSNLQYQMIINARATFKIVQNYEISKDST